MYYIGIDLGTSAVKLLLVDENGKIWNEVSREYPLSFPHPGWSEQKPEDWWNAVELELLHLLQGFDTALVKGNWSRRSDAWPCCPGSRMTM
jgi:xylulokinase